MVPGHQVVGVIEAVGANVALTPGQRVGAAWAHGTCGRCCRPCRRGHENLCERVELTGYTVHGGFAECMLARRLRVPAAEPAMPYARLYGERSVTTVTNNTRADGHAFLQEAAAAQVRVHTPSFPFEALNEALRAVKESRVDGAAVVDMI